MTSHLQNTEYILVDALLFKNVADKNTSNKT